jgi:hypothetical protein
VHPPRLPAVSPGVSAFLWAAGLGGFLFLGMVSIAISKSTSIVTSIVSAAIIFAAIRRFGAGSARDAG